VHMQQVIQLETSLYVIEIEQMNITDIKGHRIVLWCAFCGSGNHDTNALVL